MAINVGLIGFGTVGQALSRRLLHGPPGGLRLTRVCLQRSRERPFWLPHAVDCVDQFEALLSPDIDVAGGDATAVAVMSDLLSIGGGRDGVRARGLPVSASVVNPPAALTPLPTLRPPVTKGPVHVSE